MSEAKGPARPRQVTTAAWVAGAASAAMLLSVGDLMVRLKTVDLRQSVTDFLASQSGTVASVSVDEALVIARVGLMVTGAAAAAMLVFAYFAAQRDRTARLAMSLLALPLLVCGVFIDVFLVGFIVAATVLLWTGPATDWYAGRSPRAATPSGTPPPTERPAQPTGLGFSSAPPPTQSPVYPAPPPPTAAQPAPYRSAYGDPTAAPGFPQVAAPGARPRQLVIACAFTWVAAMLVTVFMALAVATLQTGDARRELTKLINDNQAAKDAGLTVDQLVTIATVAAIAMVLWALGAAAVAALAYRRHGWARIVLVISAAGAALLALVSSITFPGFLLLVAFAGGSAVLLMHRDVSAWLAAGSRPSYDKAQDQGPPKVQPPSRPW